MAKKPTKPSKKSTDRPRRKARRAPARAGKRPLRRSAKSARATRGKERAKKRSPGKLAARASPRAKKRTPPKAAGRAVAKGKATSQARDKAAVVSRKQAPKTPPKALAKPVPKPAKLPGKSPPKALAKPVPKPAKLPGKSPPKVQAVPGRAAPPGKPSAGEIAARLSAKRTERALAEGKVRSGKNGGVELRKVELTPAEAEARQTRLKNLIVLGKERGYLTYAEINDHLPDDILDAEQIEGIICMFNDMGIQVYDEAPDAETLLMSEAAPASAADDVDEEAAEAAASTLDSEFGRTTDPVRMYMREMGSVELLTREGEIEIAKRIEDGLKHMIMAISACPMTVGANPRARRQDRDGRAQDRRSRRRLDGLQRNSCQTMDDEDDLEEAEKRKRPISGAIAAENLERLKVAALERFAAIRRLYTTHARSSLQKEGYKAPKYLDLQKKISAELMQIRFTARQVEQLCDSVRCEVDKIRQIERKILDLVVNKGGMPRAGLHQEVPRDMRPRCAGSTARSRRSHAYSEIARANTGRRSSNSSRSCSTCRRAS